VIMVQRKFVNLSLPNLQYKTWFENSKDLLYYVSYLVSKLIFIKIYTNEKCIIDHKWMPHVNYNPWKELWPWWPWLLLSFFHKTFFCQISWQINITSKKIHVLGLARLWSQINDTNLVNLERHIWLNTQMEFTRIG